MTDAYPLAWPEGWKRTPSHRRTTAQFGVVAKKFSTDGQRSWNEKRRLSIADAMERVQHELEALGVKSVADDSIVSTNLKLNMRGFPRGDQGEPMDPGAAVYWQQSGKPMRVMAIDTYDRVADNLGAIAATLQAMRAIERHGGAQILDRAFTGFLALPSSGPSCWVVLGLSPGDNAATIEARYRVLAKQRHPDAGGSHAAMSELNAARDDALKVAGPRP